MSPEPWEWAPNPKGEDCGPGCEQLTFGEDVLDGQWDVWGDLVVFRDDDSTIKVVDAANALTMRLPDAHPAEPIADGRCGAYSPAIHEGVVYYVLSLYGAEPPRREIIRADLAAQTQEVIWARAETGDGEHKLPDRLDAFGDRLVASGGAGDPAEYTLSAFEPPWPTDGVALIDGPYGGYNSLHGDVAVFWDERTDPTHITAFDFAGQVFVPVTNDEEYQFAPRIFGTKIVYMDFRMGESDPYGSWRNAMIALYDLATGKTLALTNGAYIAALPDIFGGVVVWMDYRNCEKQKRDDIVGVEIWGLDLETAARGPITDLPGRPKAEPRIFGDRVFVKMFDAAYTRAGIYAFDLPIRQTDEESGARARGAE